MSLLSQLLQRALVKRPSQVIIETDRPVEIITDRGTQEQGTQLEGEAVFNALFTVLSEEQQAELVVGKLVEFEFEAGRRRWHVVTETAADRISLRANLRPEELLGRGDIALGRIAPDDERVTSPRLLPVTGGRGSAPEPDQQELLTVVNETNDTPHAHDGSLLDEIDVDVEEAAAEEPAAVMVAAGQAVGADSSGTVVAFKPPGAALAEAPTDGRRHGTGTYAAQSDLFKRIGTRQGQAERDRLLSAITAGTLCYLLRSSGGTGRVLTEAMDLPVLAVREGATPDSLYSKLSNLDHDLVVLVTVEDPSPWLPWILRRLEEGRRVIIETGARTPAGARRILLGVGATARAEAWLGCMRTASITRGDAKWNVALDEV